MPHRDGLEVSKSTGISGSATLSYVLFRVCTYSVSILRDRCTSCVAYSLAVLLFSPPMQIWNDNAGDTKPRPDVLIGKGMLSVRHLAIGAPAGTRGGKEGAGTRGRGSYSDTDEKAANGETVLTLSLVSGNERRRGKENAAGVVTLTLSYIPPRCVRRGLHASPSLAAFISSLSFVWNRESCALCVRTGRAW